MDPNLAKAVREKLIGMGDKACQESETVAATIENIATRIGLAHRRGENWADVCTVHETNSLHEEDFTFSCPHDLISWFFYVIRTPKKDWLNPAARAVFDYCLGMGLKPVFTGFHLEAGSWQHTGFWKGTYIRVRWSREELLGLESQISAELASWNSSEHKLSRGARTR